MNILMGIAINWCDCNQLKNCLTHLVFHISFFSSDGGLDFGLIKPQIYDKGALIKQLTRLEKVITKNARMRSKFADEPAKWVSILD